MRFMMGANLITLAVVTAQILDVAADLTTAAAPRNGSGSLFASGAFPVCRDDAARPFCLPANNTDVHLDERYYVTWNPAYFKPNSTISILLNSSIDTRKNVWDSGHLPSQLGATAIQMREEWLQGYTAYNLTFYARNFEAAAVYTGPTVHLKMRPLRQSQSEEPVQTTTDGMDLKVGVPVCFGFAVLLVIALALGTRRQRTADDGDVVGRRRGYLSRQSGWRRLGRARVRKDEMLLQEHGLCGSGEYTDNPRPSYRPGIM